MQGYAGMWCLPMPHDNKPATEKIHNERVSGMGRRRFTKTLLALGFGASTAATLTAEDVKAAASDQVPIVIGYRVSDGGATHHPVKKNVPADWYNDYQHARQVREREGKALLENPNVKAVSVSPGKYGGRNARINVSIDAEQPATADTVPDTVDGVPFEVNHVGGYKLGACNCPSGGNYNTWHSDDTVPGGMKICPGNGSYGTLTGWAYRNLNEYFLICNHMYGGDGTDHQGESLYQPDCSEDALGEVERGFCSYDVMLVSPTNGHQPVTEYEDATPSENITGYFTASGLGDISAANRQVEKYGCRTGRTNGYIESGDGWTSFYGCVPKTGQLEWGDNSDFDDGDSGSLVYHAAPNSSGGFRNDRIWACGVAAARTADWGSAVANFVWGTAAWKLKNDLGITLGSF